MSRYKFLIVVVIFSLPARIEVNAQEESIFDDWDSRSLDSAEVEDAIKEFRNEMAELERAYKEVFEQNRDDLLRKLDAARLEATMADELDLAVGIRDLRESVNDADLEMPMSSLLSSPRRVSVAMEQELIDLRRLVRNHDWYAYYFDQDDEKEFIFEDNDFEWRMVLEMPHQIGSGTSTLIYDPDTETFRGVFVRPSYQNTRTMEIRVKQ